MTNREIATQSDAVVVELQRMYGGETPVEVYRRCLERHTQEVRVYGQHSTLGLLLGRLCAMIECAPNSQTTREFALAVCDARHKSVVGFLSAAQLLGTRGGAATKGISTPAKRRAARTNGKLGGRPKSPMTYSIHIAYEDRPPDGQPLSARTDRSAVRELTAMLPQLRSAYVGAQIYLTWFRTSDGCRGYLNPGEGASPTGKPW